MPHSAGTEIQSHPLFWELVSRRRRFTLLLSIATLVPYTIFIFVAALSPDVLAHRIFAGSSISAGWPVGVAIIFGAWLLTGLYVRRANGEFDGITRKLVEGVVK
ncbi:DUF485 domain-containing protein [Ralstonia wenshanensis]|uniref:DUF485 domain-containing protein n=1 Tax=Ralstonia wenshanensis TaxID=2842456 RepID=UPI002AADD20D|nr:DUF485 domain-containing protein [Ralstonia wenshanensis]MDY7511225.1 DUF485 domain-containing protein [Ralstonia wenshanensis]